MPPQLTSTFTNVHIRAGGDVSIHQTIANPTDNTAVEQLNPSHPSPLAVAFPVRSLGDILALTRLAITDVQSLNDHNYSFADCLDLIAELNTFETTLKIINQRMTLQPQQTPIVAACINDVTRRCRLDMEKFRDNVRSYQSGLSRCGPRGWIHKILWAIWKKGEVTSFRGKLTRHQVELSVCLQFPVLEVVSRNNGKIPCSVGYTMHNAIKLVDALGRSFVLPMEVCSMWKTMHDIILASFRDQPGERLVKRDDYYLTCNGGKQIIRTQDWRRTIRPGMAVDMGIILRQARRMLKDDRRTCPICHYRNSELTANEGWVDCLGLDCNARFQILNVISDKDNDEDGVEDSDEDMEVEEVLLSEPRKPSGTTPMNSGNEGTLEDNELRHLRNIHLLLLEGRNSQRNNPHDQLDLTTMETTLGRTPPVFLHAMLAVIGCDGRELKDLSLEEKTRLYDVFKRIMKTYVEPPRNGPGTGSIPQSGLNQQPMSGIPMPPPQSPHRQPLPPLRGQKRATPGIPGTSSAALETNIRIPSVLLNPMMAEADCNGPELEDLSFEEKTRMNEAIATHKERARKGAMRAVYLEAVRKPVMATFVGRTPHEPENGSNPRPVLNQLPMSDISTPPPPQPKRPWRGQKRATSGDPGTSSKRLKAL